MQTGRNTTPGRPSAKARRASSALELGLLVNVARIERRGLVRGKPIDVAMHPDSAAMDHALNYVSGRGIENVARTVDVHLAIDAVGVFGLAIKGGDVEYVAEPATARSTARVSTRSPSTTSMPWACRSAAALALRASTRTRQPRTSSARAR